MPNIKVLYIYIYIVYCGLHRVIHLTIQWWQVRFLHGEGYSQAATAPITQEEAWFPIPTSYASFVLSQELSYNQMALTDKKTKYTWNRKRDCFQKVAIVSA